MIREYPGVLQRDGYDCGTAGADGVFRMFGLPASATALAIASEQDGTHPSTLEGILRRGRLLVQSGSMTVADLAFHTRLGRPVLCPVDLYGGHWLTVLGVTRTRVHYWCPADGPGWTPRARWEDNDFWRDSTRSGHAFDKWGIAAWV